MVTKAKPWAERRDAVRPWIEFVGHFGRLDVRPLVQRLEIDSVFVTTLESLLKIGPDNSTSPRGPWSAFEAIRDHCILELQVEQRLPVDAAASTGRVSPFSVPLEVLRAVFEPILRRSASPDNEFNASRLRVKHEGFVLDLKDYATEASDRFTVSQDQMFLMTSIWAKVTPDVELLRHRVEVCDEASARFQNLQLGAIVAAPQALFLPLAPWSSVRVVVRQPSPRVNEPQPKHVLIAMEGWSYLW